MEGFKCRYCFKWVPFFGFPKTERRNHCPFCLCSQHLDSVKSGDRKSQCKSKMQPIGLIFKQEGIDRYGKERQGELMLVHKCLGCKKISINRIAGDDNPSVILSVFEKSKKLDKEQKEYLQKKNIKLLKEKNKEEILIQLFGKEIKNV